MMPLEQESFEAGDRAGFLADDGYRYITIDGVLHREDHLIWLYVHGEYPTGEIVHINGNKADSTLANLRLQVS